MNYEFYRVNQLMEVLPIDKENARKIINRLRNELEKEYPNEYAKLIYWFGNKMVIIPKWYYEEKISKKAPVALTTSAKN